MPSEHQDLLQALRAKHPGLLNHVLSTWQNRDIDCRCTVEEHGRRLQGSYLHLAIRDQWTEGVQTLLEHGAKVQVPLQTRRGRSVYPDALDYAQKIRAEQSIINLLLQHQPTSSALADTDEKPAETLECTCCCEEYAPETMITCRANDSHYHCHSCILNLYEVTDIKKNSLICVSTPECTAAFNPEQLRKILKEKYDLLAQNEMIRELPPEIQEQLKACPTCGTAALLPEGAQEFNCPNPDCNFSSCIGCGQKAHRDLSCEEAQNSRLTKLERYKHEIEDAMSQAAHIQNCPGCQRKVSKISDCNHMECPCGTHFCNVCDIDITDEQINHFSNNINGQGEFDAWGHRIACGLYEERVDHEAPRRVAAAKEATIQAILRRDPTVDIEILRRIGEKDPSVVPVENTVSRPRGVPQYISEVDYWYRRDLIIQRHRDEQAQALRDYASHYNDYLRESQDAWYASQVAFDQYRSVITNLDHERNASLDRLGRRYRRQLAYYRGDRTFEGQVFTQHGR